MDGPAAEALDVHAGRAHAAGLLGHLPGGVDWTLLAVGGATSIPGALLGSRYTGSGITLKIAKTGTTLKVGKRPVYLCFDMDVFDPSTAPGVCTPSWGGLSAREARTKTCAS